jgi:type I restriction enzyme S subunit
LGELSVASDYGTSQKANYEADGPPILRIPNVAHGRLDLRDLKYGTKPAELKVARALRPGDFLIIRTNGSRDLIGRGGIVETEFSAPHFHASYLIRFRLAGNAPLWRWVSLIWSAPALRHRIQSMAATSAGQYNVSLSALARLPVRVPVEQDLPAHLEALERDLGALDALEAEIASAMVREGALRRGILHQAFSGRLALQ